MRFLSLVFVIALLNPVCFAEIINIPDDFETIQEGIDASEDGDTVLVQPGLYHENLDFNGMKIVLASLFLIDGDTTRIDSTIIDGNNNGSVIVFENYETDETLLTGFTLRNGSGTEHHRELCGGAVFCTYGEPVISHCKISGNTSDMGAGVYAFSLDDSPYPGPQIINCTIRNNTASEGAGIYLDSRITNILDCSIYGNSAESGGGGALLLESETLIEGCSFSQNSSNTDGGGLYLFWNNHYQPTVRNCVFNGNTAVEQGGGINCYQTISSISDCILENNNATDGAGIGCDRSSLMMSGVNAKNNHSEFQAGAIYCCESRSTLTRSVISGNRAIERCGGIVLDSTSTMEVQNVTFTLNWAGAVRCGIHLRMGSESTIVNSIFWLNYPAEICFGDGEGNMVNILHCDIEEGVEGIIGEGEVNWLSDPIDADPQFADPDNDDFHLTEDSPCIDAGIAFFVFEGDTIINLAEEEYIGDAPDIGAFEFDPQTVESKPNILNDYLLEEPFPNPFNTSTTISFILPVQSDVVLQVYNTRGQLVDVLLDRMMPVGRHSIMWDAGGFCAGVYLAKMKRSEDGAEEIRKLVFVK